MLFKNLFREYLSKTDPVTRRFVTLGPNCTSSSYAVEWLVARFPAQIDLFETYEEAALAVTNRPDDTGLIVANAYAHINRFYISNDLFPVGAFFHDTPAYVIAAKSTAVLQCSELKVATHPAPGHLISGVIDHPDIRIVHVDSTYQAAEQTSQDKCDACLTTKPAADILGLDTLVVAFPAIPMLWTVFINTKYKECKIWNKKPLLSFATTSRTA